ncbi:tyrosine phosphatase-like protein [Microdochium trichocladiopsis]|uniref:Very-long-chain (3R)-3-hydroxyacyl-CoA dehydratase n=1 Tax=Microdochium trichocladiopsis TaxID=1682393 RepID=A0A9P9BUZ2_9PEZI|nr:tyrosine phosphatase-like protein [Microdochium trichocladiopsis]KAH7038126.1 tyrosine phosphatase-like protein [Microdochium trichocladiopsis]
MADTKKAPRPASSPLKNGYLVLYNAVSAGLWLTVLSRVIATNLLSANGAADVCPTTGELCKWVQTLAGMEVLHSLLGIVRAPFVTTFMQVFSRYAIVWGVTDLFPNDPAIGRSPVYSSMLVAWGVTEVVRYSYFALTLSGFEPKFLHWMRYHGFFVLYPLGISSEAWLIWKSVGPAEQAVGEWYSWLLLAYVVGVYPPSAYILYTHMMAQRRKVMRALKANSGKAQ